LIVTPRIFFVPVRPHRHDAAAGGAFDFLVPELFLGLEHLLLHFLHLAHHLLHVVHTRQLSLP